MPTYLYEIVTPHSDAGPIRFEVFQGMNDAPLTVDPISGMPVMRIITGGIGIKLKVLKRSTVVNKRSAAATACGCASAKSRLSKR